ncbi:MAG: prepilin peptidase [Planctomycetaceae bacterium]|nr:prepilin peptidase [Planctomycetaceae bacterium]
MDFQELIVNNWHVKLVSLILIVAAWIDGRELRVPNWITYPMVLSGLVYCTCIDGLSGLGWAVLGMIVGLLTLLPLYSVGGMGAGDVKLMAGIGAWLGVKTTLWAFAATTVVGAVMAVIMVVWRGALYKHYAQLMMILDEWREVKNPRRLSELAAERKPQMFLLPYGIPICIGSIGYFFFVGMI